MAIAAVRQAVLNTAELVENIILQLPPLHIPVVQRVCKQWKATTEKSKAIREKLFLHSDNMPPKEWEPVSLVWGKVSVAKMPSETPFITLSDRASGKQISARLNPLLKIYKDSVSRRQNSYSGVKISFAFREIRAFVREVFRNPRLGSWRSMRVTDPPCTEALVIVRWMGIGPPHVRFGVHHHVVDPNGITLGSLIDATIDQPGNVNTLYGKMGCDSENTTLREAIEKFETKWGRQSYHSPHFHCDLYWKSDLRST